MKVPTPTRAAEVLPSLMFEMGRRMKAAFARDCAPLSMLHVETLRFLTEAGAPTMREVAAYLKITAPTATDIVDGLASEGLIERRADDADRRKVRLAVTKKGDRLIAAITKKRFAAFAEIVAPLTASDRKELARILRIITQD